MSFGTNVWKFSEIFLGLKKNIFRDLYENERKIFKEIILKIPIRQNISVMFWMDSEHVVKNIQ